MQNAQEWIGNTLRDLLTAAAQHFRETQFKPSQAKLGEGPAGATFGDLYLDRDLPADKEMGEWWVRAVRSRSGEIRQIRRIVIEGREEAVEVSPNGVATLYIDPLDNSQGFHACMAMDPRDRGLSPHTFATVITLVREWADDGRPINPPFSDIMAAGMISLSLSTPDPAPLLAYPQEPGMFSTRRGSEPAPFTPKAGGTFGLNATVLFEAYYPESRAVVEAGFRDVSGALRSMGCTALEMVYPSIGAAAGYICTSQKLHELGAAWLIAQSRDAEVFTWSVEEGLAVRRRPLDDERFIFNSKMPVCFARDMAMADELWRRIRSGYATVFLRSVGEDGCE